MAFTLGASALAVGQTDKPSAASTSRSSLRLGAWSTSARRSSDATTAAGARGELVVVSAVLPTSSAPSTAAELAGSRAATSTLVMGHQPVSVPSPAQSAVSAPPLGPATTGDSKLTRTQLEIWASARALHTKVNGFFQSLVSRVNSYNSLLLSAAPAEPEASLQEPAAATVTKLDGPSSPAGAPSTAGLTPIRTKAPSASSASTSNQARARSNSKSNTPRKSIEHVQPAPVSVTLQPFLSVADSVEVSYATMLSDLCNLAYDVQQISVEQLEQLYHLSLIATSASFGHDAYQATETIVSLPDVSAEMANSQRLQPATAAMQAEEMLQTIYEATMDFDVLDDSAVVGEAVEDIDDDEEPRVYESCNSGATLAVATTCPQHDRRSHNHLHALAHDAKHSHGDASVPNTPAHTESASNNIVPFTGSPGNVTPNLTMLELSTPEAVTAALTAYGNAFSHPVYVSELQHALNNIATYEEDDEVVRSSGTNTTASGAASPKGRWSPRTSRPGSPFGSPSKAASAGDTSAFASVMTVEVDEEELVRSAAGHAAAAEHASEHAAAMEDTDLPSDPSLHEGHLSSPPIMVLPTTKAPPPSAWFCVDDAVRATRYFVIQGSSNLQHWHINLAFEPVTFEHPSLGVRVHRGVYEAALELYDAMLPLVQSHIGTSPFATVALAGHSLGGSLATVLMLLFVYRGVLRPDQISPIYTFGAPAVFCQGAAAEVAEDRCAHCSLACEMRPDAAAAGRGGKGTVEGEVQTCTAFPQPGSSTAANAANAAAAGAGAATAAAGYPPATHHCGAAGIMACLGLSDEQVVNVIMHKDIVPRAFVCDYGSVAGVLQRWWPSFKDHSSLQPGAGPHKSLYSFLGRVAILRPREKEEFVLGDVAHPMLPNHAALYRVCLPEDAGAAMPLTADAAGMLSLSDWSKTMASLSSLDDLMDSALTAVTAATKLAGPGSPARAATSDEQPALAVPAVAAAAAAECGGAAVGATPTKTGRATGKAASALRKALMSFMNQPHPLTTLTDYSAYGTRGAISRYHNPDNYTRALRGLLHM